MKRNSRKSLFQVFRFIRQIAKVQQIILSKPVEVWSNDRHSFPCSLFLSIVTIRVSIDFVMFRIIWGSILEQIVLIDVQRAFLLLYCFPPSYDFAFTIAHKFSIGLRSGEFAGQFFRRFPAKLWMRRKTLAMTDAWDGALSCMITKLSWRPSSRRCISGIKFCSRNSVYVKAVTFTPYFTLKGPMSLDPRIAAQNLTTPPPCCLRSLTGMSSLFNTPSGSSKVARHSPVNKTISKSCFMYLITFPPHNVACIQMRNIVNKLIPLNWWTFQ